jgi:DNA polymerase-3 subunit alpha
MVFPAHRTTLVLLAQNDIGYKNLIKLVSAGYLEGFYYNRALIWTLLSQHAEGLIGLTACLKGAVPYWYIHDNETTSAGNCWSISRDFR